MCICLVNTTIIFIYQKDLLFGKRNKESYVAYVQRSTIVIKTYMYDLSANKEYPD